MALDEKERRVIVQALGTIAGIRMTIADQESEATKVLIKLRQNDHALNEAYNDLTKLLKSNPPSEAGKSNGA